MTYYDYAELVLQVIGLFSIIAAVTPNKKDNELLAHVRKFIDALAMNVLNAKNKDS